MYYLYNGERLPELPEYDTAAYPYAVLDKTNTGASFLFYAFKSRPYYGTNPADSTIRGVYSTGGAKVYYFDPADGGNEWVHHMDTENSFAAENGNENTLFWTNVDILNELDGSVWLAASAPVPVAEANWRDSFLLGLAMGLTGKPLHFVQMEPVAYLYNGVRLPKLPEWDKKKLPYALISDRYSLEPTLVLTSVPLSTPVKATFGPAYVKIANDCQYMRYILENNTWVIYTELTTSTNASEGYADLVWSSYDIPDLDNTVYLAASDPVPVYE